MKKMIKLAAIGAAAGLVLTACGDAPADDPTKAPTAGETKTSAGPALKAIDEQRPSLVLLDVWLHGSPMDGLEVLDAIKEREPELPVIIFSGHGNIDTAVAAISRGAVDFIEKPFEAEKLLHLVGIMLKFIAPLI